jgi:hypothetical protein
MRLAFGIALFVVTAEFAASERVECISGAHCSFEGNLRSARLFSIWQYR